MVRDDSFSIVRDADFSIVRGAVFSIVRSAVFSIVQGDAFSIVQGDAFSIVWGDTFVEMLYRLLGLRRWRCSADWSEVLGEAWGWIRLWRSRPEGGGVFEVSWIYDFVELLGWDCVPCQVTRSGDQVITLLSKRYVNNFSQRADNYLKKKMVRG